MITKFKIFEADSWGVEGKDWDYYDDYDHWNRKESEPTYNNTIEDKIRTWDKEGIDFFTHYSTDDFIDLIKNNYIHINDYESQDLLEWIIIKNEVNMLKILLKNYDVNLTYDDNYLIRRSCRMGKTDIVKELLKHKEVDPSNNNNIAIRTSSENGYLEVVKELLKDDRVDPTDHYNYALNSAINNGHIEIANLLLDDNRVDPGKYTIDSLISSINHGYNDLTNRLMGYKSIVEQITFNFIKRHKNLYVFMMKNPNMLKYVPISDEQRRELFPVYKSKKIDRSI
jgi:ankyrin repeat protein